MNNKMVSWLSEKIDEKGWSYRELGRRSGISHVTISNVMSGSQNPGLDFCIGVGGALNIPPDTLLRKMGLLPPTYPTGDTVTPSEFITEITDILKYLSPHTLADYQIAYRRLVQWIGGDKNIAEITLIDLKSFFAHLASETWAVRSTSPIQRQPTKLSNKTLLNHHIALSALWTWAVENEFITENLLHNIPRPRPQQRQITPYSERDLHALLRACNETKIFILPPETKPSFFYC